MVAQAVRVDHDAASPCPTATSPERCGTKESLPLTLAIRTAVLCSASAGLWLFIFLSGRLGCFTHVVAFGMAAHGWVQVLSRDPSSPEPLPVLRDRDAKSGSTLHPVRSRPRASAAVSQPSAEHINRWLTVPGSTFQPRGLDPPNRHPGFRSISPGAPRFKAALNC